MQPYRIKSINEYHQLMGLPKPEHPLISVINLAILQHMPVEVSASMVFDFYSISMKRDFHAKMKYGQQKYDFDEGIMFFISPGQVFGIEVEKGSTVKRSGWLLLIHPDFLWNSALAKTMKQYDFFDYSVNEALFLSEKEETTIIGMMENIQHEYESRIDKFSQDIIIAQIELLLKHAQRFYNRQFITRQIVHHQMLERLEDLLTAYFNGREIIQKGLPTVAHIAQSLNVSPGYLSGSLKVLTGLNTQQHIHQKLIDKAKEKLSTTNLSVSEIAYELGFEHPQSFSKLFKTKTNFSPLEFRQSFN
ncbi:helix-turn-helix domain-containing protein [Mucilaginibacter sp. X4EP1]|jgi:AraC family transcriptional regulator, transcriptional activator of pobA|uniref:helix-turn-helix domain-containing protein n=1 Tax=Mucilaginibacter sp. X4EP1 TaxID=2723092 RepID=UPI002167EF01|nr:response regulator transcription factor [Mucilaginibacter sp. X4EP1]MCS3815064.1 AraC-like DNA-binding protein [Mucilaginibacter sp. X4EP1]